jgi:hypothetical protein
VPTQLTYLNPAPNLSTSLEVLKDFGSQIISEHLGDGAQTVAENRTFTSGLDRMIAMSDITNIIESNQQGYSKVENDLYLIIKAFFEAKNDFRFRSEKLSVNYSKAKPIQSEEEILRNIEKKIALGLIEKYEALLMLNPNMTSEAAMRKIEKVKQEKMNEVNFFMGDISGDTNN